MKRILTFASLLMFTVCVFAVQAYRRPFQAVLDNGNPVIVRQIGDEFFHCYVDEEGNELERLADGSFTRVRAPWLAAARRAEGEQRRQLAYGQRMRRAEKARKAGAFVGAKRGLVILVSFADEQIQEKHTREVFDAMFNKEGYNDNGHVGSVRDYFKAQSYDQFEINFDVVGPYTLKDSMAYYGENNLRGDDKRVGEMIAEAVKLADKDVNFEFYDWDDDDEVDQVFVIYAGYGEASGASSKTIWPVEWWLSSSDYGKTIRLDNVTIDQFACSCELGGTKGTQLAGIGTACHEFSHCLGLPDFYATNNANSFGLDTWSVMDYGCYNGTIDAEGYTQANIPCGYTSYERMSCGWLNPEELADGRTIKNMKALTDEPQAYIIYNDAHRDEYYLLENRQQTSWDKGIGGHGMLVVHVDYLASAWEDNVVNNDKSHQRCTIIPADNSFKTGSYVTAKELAGDPYPGTSRNTSLTDFTKPAATLYNEAPDGRLLMGKPIEEIKESGGLISFLFMGGDAGSLRTPVAEAATDVKTHSFTAHWSRVTNAENYTLAVTSGEGTPVYYENIVDTFYVVAGLDSTVVHSYCVKAKAKGRESDWSNAISVRLKGFGEWTDWEPYGDGTAVYHYSQKGIYSNMGDKTYPIFVRTSNATPTLRQFRLYGWGDDVTLDIDYDAITGQCSVAQQYIGYTDTYYGCGKVYVADEVYYQNTVLGRSTTWSAYPSQFDASSGTFTLYVAYYDLTDLSSNWGEAVETITVSGGNFKDYSIDVALGALHELDNGRATQDVVITPGANVSYWRYVVIDKKLSGESSELSGYINGITNGTITSTSCTGTQSFGITIPSGTYTVLAVTYDDVNTPQRYDFKTFIFSSGDEWKVLGTASYTDDALCSIFGMDAVTYDVEVHEKTSMPGFFRMKNPYRNHPENDSDDVLAGDFYIEIDATNPQAVTIALQAMGIDWGYGECSMASVSEDGYAGKFEKSVITFPKPRSIIIMMGGERYFGNRNGGFRLDLTTCGISLPQTLQQENTDVVPLYDLQGRPVEEPQQGGLYIRNGRKVIVK